MWPRSKDETEIQAVCRFYIQFNHVYTFECVFAWSYAHIDIHNGFWYRCRLCLAVSIACFFPKEADSRSGWQQLMWPIVPEQWPWMQAELLDIMMIILKTMMNQDYDYFRLFPYVTSIYIYIIYEIYIYIYIFWCMQYIVCHILLFTTCLRKLMAPKMSLRSSDFRTSSAHSTEPCRLVGDRWLGAGGRTALGVAQCGTFALRNCWNRNMCCRDLVVALRHIWVLMVSCVKLFLDVNDRKLMVRGSCPWAKESQKHTKIASVLSQRCEGRN